MFIRLAAVAGRVFDYELVRQAGDWRAELALGALEALLERGFIRADQVAGGFAFTHHLVQEIIYRDLTGPRRAYLHRRLAEALPPTDFEALAYHFAQAGDDERARSYYLQAGDHAWRLLALQDAAGHYQAALARWPEADGAGRAEALYKLGQCQWVIMEQQSALAAFEAARALFESLGQWARAGDVDRLIGRMYWELGDVQAAWPHYRRALAILERGPETVELARAISGISQMYMLASEYDEAIQWGERALALAERLQAEDVIVHALNNVGVSRMNVHRHDPEQGLAMLRESLRRAIACGLPHDACRAYLNMGDGLVGLSRYAEARAIYHDLYGYASQKYVRAFIGAALLLSLGLDWLAGRWRAALVSRSQVIAVTKGPWRVWAATRFAHMENDLGRAEAARLELERMLPDALRWGEMQTTVPYLAQLVRTYAALGREAQAETTGRQLLDLIDHNASLHSECVMALLIICRWYATRPGALDAAQGCVVRLERSYSQNRSPEAEAALAEGRGIVALAAGHLPEAGAQFQQAATCWQAIGCPYDQARALAGLGRARLTLGDAAARTAFNGALALFDTLAAELDDGDLKRSFLASPLVRETRRSNP
jgi:tetratricopeptide (TPR) repeat protein